MGHRMQALQASINTRLSDNRNEMMKSKMVAVKTFTVNLMSWRDMMSCTKLLNFKRFLWRKRMMSYTVSAETNSSSESATSD